MCIHTMLKSHMRTETGQYSNKILMYAANELISFNLQFKSKGLIIPTKLEHDTVPCVVSPMKVTLNCNFISVHQPGGHCILLAI